MKLTLDWNCVIEVEENRPQATSVRDLISRHRKGQFEVALLAASASENAKSKRFPGNATLFVERVSALGWSDLPLVLMPGIIGLSYFDFCFYVGDAEKFQSDMDALWQVIAPNVARRPADHLPEGIPLSDEAIQSQHLWKWRNTWCDVVSAYSHIYAGRDIFVTNNTRDFQNNADKLSALGMRCITSPIEALSAVDRFSSGEV